MHGFVAHELQQSAPHAVSGVKDETAIVGVAKDKDKDGNIVAENFREAQCPKGAAWTETGITADLTAAVQEKWRLICLARSERLRCGARYYSLMASIEPVIGACLIPCGRFSNTTMLS